jgi:hypothetical protein
VCVSSILLERYLLFYVGMFVCMCFCLYFCVGMFICLYWACGIFFFGQIFAASRLDIPNAWQMPQVHFFFFFFE